MKRETQTIVSHTPEPTKILRGTGCLVVFKGRDRDIGKRYFLDSPTQIIGRSDDADIHVDAESVSRHHVKLVTAQGCTYVQDLDSTNGTFVNHHRIDHARLHDGDLLGVGEAVFKYLSAANVEISYHSRVYKLSTVDALTRAYNKRFFMETLTYELKRSQRYRRWLSLGIFDVDYFKTINDTYGHVAGDWVLQELACLVYHNIRSHDVLARYGGEEFAIIFPELDSMDCWHVCEKLRHIIEEHAFVWGKETIWVTVSLGMCSIQDPQVLLDADAFIALADAQLYRAKQAGRNQVCPQACPQAFRVW